MTEKSHKFSLTD